MIRSALEQKRINPKEVSVVAWKGANSILKGAEITSQKYKFVMVSDVKWNMLNTNKNIIRNTGDEVDRFFVALHSENIMESQKKGMNHLFPGKCMFLEYSHSNQNTIYKNAATLIGATTEDAFNTALHEMIDYFKKHSKKSLIANILHFFLPLDIDMQAMEIIWDEKKDKSKAYLTEMLKEAEKKYVEKFDEAQKLKADIHDTELKNKLEDMLGADRSNSTLYKFLKCLDNLKEKAKDSEISEEDVKKVLEYFNSVGYNSFHKWYCALAKCLRGEEACKEE